MSASQQYIINCGNIFLKERCAQELIFFTEKGPFKISKNKNPTKITHYTVLVYTLSIFQELSVQNVELKTTCNCIKVVVVDNYVSKPTPIYHTYMNFLQSKP